MRPATLEELLQARASQGEFARKVINEALTHLSGLQIMDIMLRLKRAEISLPEMFEQLFPNQVQPLPEQRVWCQQLCLIVQSALREWKLLYGDSRSTAVPLGLPSEQDCWLRSTS